ncbi:Hypothetical protein NGAL_HAMBI2427_47850 [Neorhizobium galegae bv. orientalis]|uniref:Uncharacterized protein n=1 Tax=Neorhizobium galegae bv. orientalis str. HAMBI 540 TaxID=1028800 RepID=A0A068SRK2_NEOGA|nr:Hypothetical protein RG540_CH15440 [Neorhizobium galegae bv. orientalis str. HAMBI 540]CDZ52717.1 Hypothetical protein NGAL_HAMBI2427_47850 [Neorhizobium galegae bv. orientalis]
MTGSPGGSGHLSVTGRSQHRPDECRAADTGRGGEEYQQESETAPPCKLVSAGLIVGVDATRGPRAMWLGAGSTEPQPVSLVPRVQVSRLDGPRIHGDRASASSTVIAIGNLRPEAPERPVREPLRPLFSKMFSKSSGVTHRKQQRRLFEAIRFLKKPWAARCESPGARRRDSSRP